MSYTLAARLSMITGLRSLMDSGGPGQIRFYEDPQPSNPAAFPVQPPLCTIILPEPSGTINSSVEGLAVYSITDLTATVFVSGQIAWAMFVNADNEVVCVERAGLSTDEPLPKVVVSDRQVYVGGSLTLVSASWVM